MAGPEELAPQSALSESRGIPGVDHWIRDAGRHLGLQFPVLVQQLANVVEATVLALLLHRAGELAHPPHEQASFGVGELLRLTRQDLRRTARPSREEDERPGFELADDRRLADHRIDGDRVVRVEADEIETAECRGVLILLADRLAAFLDFDVRRLPRER